MYTLTLELTNQRINVLLPSCWEDFSDKDYRFIVQFFLLHSFYDTALYYLCYQKLNLSIETNPEGKTSYLIKDTNHVISPSSILQIADKLATILERPQTTPKRFNTIQKHIEAKPALLPEFSFSQWLELNNYFTAYMEQLQNHDMRKEIAIEMAKLLHYNPDKIKDLTPAEELNVFMWVETLRRFYANQFPNLFQASETPDNSTPLERTNAMIRALTGGDVCKEEIVLNLDFRRALTELNEKAKEIKQMKQT